jgi:hypothetical protein
MTSKKVPTPAVTNYQMVEIQSGTILVNAAGTRQIRIIRDFVRKNIGGPTVYVYSVLDKDGQVSHNDQKTSRELVRSFPVKVA